MRKLLLFGLSALLMAGCSSEGDLPEPKPVTPVTSVTPEEPTDTKELEPETPTVKTYPARYCVARMDITVDGGMAITSKDKSAYQGCTIKIEADTAVWNYEGRGRIRGRGNSTWEWYPKKPYRIKLDEKVEILGLDANKDWVMLANYRDPTNLMNTFVFEMGQGLGMPYTNHTRFVEVTLNGDYKGLYQLTEQVEVAKGRVDIGKKKGWLLSLDVDDGPKEAPGAVDHSALPLGSSKNFWSEVYRLPVCVKSPEAEDYATPETLREDARDALATLETAIQRHDYDALAKLCDIPVMIDYLLIQEFVYNVEVAAPRSIFLYKDKGDDAKWTFGPLWDFDAGFDFDWSQMTTGHKFFSDYRETVLGTDPARHVSDYTYTSSFFTDMLAGIGCALALWLSSGLRRKSMLRRQLRRWIAMPGDGPSTDSRRRRSTAWRSG